MYKGWFITGTDTGVGKTCIAQAVLAAAVRAGKQAVGMKPVASGCRTTIEGLRNDDAEALMQAANVAAAYDDVNPYAFAPAISPHLAAQATGARIDISVVRTCFARLTQRADCVVVEGAGGWLTPVSAEHSMADIASALGLPVLLVVGMRLGCLNHALLTRAAIDRSGLLFAGWIANCIEPAMEQLDENVATLTRVFNTSPLVIVPHTADMTSALATEQLRNALFKSD